MTVCNRLVNENWTEIVVKRVYTLAPQTHNSSIVFPLIMTEGAKDGTIYSKLYTDTQSRM